LHAYHGGDVAAFTRTILRQDWSALAPDEASAAHHTGRPRGHRPSHISAMLGVGYYYTDMPPGEPITGTIDEQPDLDYEWLYLFSHDHQTLRVLANDATANHTTHSTTADTILVPRWTVFRIYPVADLDGIDPAAIPTA
jgi:hypothetical protein